MGEREIFNAQHWRNRADELRTIAENHISIETRAILIRCAEDYDKMAAHADKQLSLEIK